MKRKKKTDLVSFGGNGAAASSWVCLAEVFLVGAVSYVVSTPRGVTALIPWDATSLKAYGQAFMLVWVSVNIHCMLSSIFDASIYFQNSMNLDITTDLHAQHILSKVCTAFIQIKD
jgi:hypothetical protein